MQARSAYRRAAARLFISSAFAAIGACCCAIAPAHAAESLAGKVMTVNGPIAPEALGLTLPHEHLFSDFQPPDDTPEGWRAIGEEKPATAEDQAFFAAPLTIERLGAALMGKPNRDNRRLDDEATAIKEVTDYKWFGGRSIVDATSIGFDRDPAALKRVSDATGVNVIMGSGWYEHGYVGNALDHRSVADLADEIARDIQVGVDGTGIRAGIIGEVGVKDASQPYEKKILAAAARASRLTGAPISVHFAKGHHDQLAALKILKQNGADLTRVAMGHSNPIANDLPLMKQILQQGAYLEFDLLGDAPHILTEVPDHDVALAIVELFEQGYGKQILLSQDVCTKTDLKSYGGSGYSFIPEQFVPYLKQLGVSDEQIALMLIENPRRLLTFAAAKAEG